MSLSVRGKRASPYLSLHSQGACRHEGLAGEHAGVVHQVASGNIVRTVGHDVIYEGEEVKAS